MIPVFGHTCMNQYDEVLREQMFPTAVAAPVVETASKEDLDEHGRLHRRWAAQRITISRG